MNHLEITIQLPEWMSYYVQDNITCPGTEDKMRLAIELSRENVTRRTGGPFGAAVFSADGTLIAAGVNIVEPGRCSVLHAEIVAIMMAQKVLGRYDMSDKGRLHFDLIATTEPCAMCYGAVVWSGVKRLICGARGKDAEDIGFDEGPKLPNWKQALEDRSIEVITDVLRDDAAAVLRQYAAQGGQIYNAGT